MKRISLSCLLAVVMMSCNEKPKADSSKKNIETPVITESSTDSLSFTKSCYKVEDKDKDSVYISLEDNLGTITGKMRYKNADKDNSFGTLFGSSSGDTLKLTYDFEREGTPHQRDIYFLIKDDVLIEGTGERFEEGNHSLYKNPEKLQYSGNKIPETECLQTDKALNF